MRPSIRNAWTRLFAAWRAVFGADEVLLIVGLALITAALWPLACLWTGTGLPALLAPGLVVIYVALPSRQPFVAKASATEARRKD